MSDNLRKYEQHVDLLNQKIKVLEEALAASKTPANRGAGVPKMFTEDTKYTHGLSKLAADVKAAPQKAIVEGYANYLSNPKGASQKPAQFVSNDEGTKIIGQSRIVYGGFESKKSISESNHVYGDESQEDSQNRRGSRLSRDEDGNYPRNSKPRVPSDAEIANLSDEELEGLHVHSKQSVENPAVERSHREIHAEILDVLSQAIQNRNEAYHKKNT